MTDLLHTALPFAHAGHWFASILYLMPVVVLGIGIVMQRRRDHALEESGERVADEDVPFTDE